MKDIKLRQVHIKDDNGEYITINALGGDQSRDVEQLKNEMPQKLTEPTGAQVGQFFRVASIDKDGHCVLEAVDIPIINPSDYVLPLKVNTNGLMTVEEAYNLTDGIYYFIKPLYNASSDGHSIHGMCSVSEHFINNYDYGIYFGDYSSSTKKFTTVGSIDGYGHFEKDNGY